MNERKNPQKQLNRQILRERRLKMKRWRYFRRFCFWLLLLTAGGFLYQARTEFSRLATRYLSNTLASSTTSTMPTRMETTVSEAPPATKAISIHELADFKSQVTSPESGCFERTLEEVDFIGTALVIKEGKILLQKAYGYANIEKKQGNTIDSLYQIGSIQKSITGIMIAKLIGEQQLSFDTLLAQFYPDVPGSQSITIKQMLNMTSGLVMTNQPEGLTDETEIVHYYRQHVQVKDSGKYSYSPVNYNLLAGIILRLTQRDYWDNFQEMVAKPSGINAEDYQDWYQSVRHTTSYQQEDGKDYQKIIHPTADIFARELGTGNIAMTPSNLYWLYHELFAGKIINQEMQQQLYDNPIGSEVYQGGLTNQQDYFRSNGIFRGQRAMLLITPDAQNAVILMSNQNMGKQHSELMETLFTQLMGYTPKF